MAIELDDRELLRLYLDDLPHPETGDVFFRDDQLDRLVTDTTDLYGAAAMGWRIKAARVVEWFNVDLDGAELSMGQAFRHAMDMAKAFGNESSGEIRSVKMDSEFIITSVESEMT